MRLPNYQMKVMACNCWPTYPAESENDTTEKSDVIELVSTSVSGLTAQTRIYGRSNKPPFPLPSLADDSALWRAQTPALCRKLANRTQRMPERL
jgi:hypothetical protein